MTGANHLNEQQQVGLSGELTLSGRNGELLTVSYSANDTVGDIISRINYSGADVVARLDAQGNLTLKGSLSADGSTPDFVIRHVEDSGQFWLDMLGF